MATVTTQSQWSFTQTPEQVYDFVSNPANWPVAYPGSMHIEGLPAHVPLVVGDTWAETGPHGEIYSWQLAVAVRPLLWVSTTTGRLGHAGDGSGGREGKITVEYRFLQPGCGDTLFQRTMTMDVVRESPFSDEFYGAFNPVHAERYFTAIARELAS